MGGITDCRLMMAVVEGVVVIWKRHVGAIMSIDRGTAWWWTRRRQVGVHDSLDTTTTKTKLYCRLKIGGWIVAVIIRQEAITSLVSPVFYFMEPCLYIHTHTWLYLFIYWYVCVQSYRKRKKKKAVPLWRSPGREVNATEASFVDMPFTTQILWSLISLLWSSDSNHLKYDCR